MVIDFKKLRETSTKHFYNGQKNTVARMFADECNRIMVGTLEPGASIGMHTHEDSSEIIYILRGEGCGSL